MKSHAIEQAVLEGDRRQDSSTRFLLVIFGGVEDYLGVYVVRSTWHPTMP
jgi:hypothetical protein